MHYNRMGRFDLSEFFKYFACFCADFFCYFKYGFITTASSQGIPIILSNEYNLISMEVKNAHRWGVCV